MADLLSSRRNPWHRPHFGARVILCAILCANSTNCTPSLCQQHRLSQESIRKMSPRTCQKSPTSLSCSRLFTPFICWARMLRLRGGSAGSTLLYIKAASALLHYLELPNVLLASANATTDASIACTKECTSTQLGEEAASAERNRKNVEEALQGDREDDLGLLFQEPEAFYEAPSVPGGTSYTRFAQIFWY